MLDPKRDAAALNATNETNRQLRIASQLAAIMEMLT